MGNIKVKRINQIKLEKLIKKQIYKLEADGSDKPNEEERIK